MEVRPHSGPDLHRLWHRRVPLGPAAPFDPRPALYRLLAILEPRYQRDPYVPFTAGPEGLARRHDYSLLHQQQRVSLVVPIRYRDPQVEARFGGQIFQAGFLEERGEEIPLLAEDAPPLLDVGVVIPGRGRGVLHEGLGGHADGGTELPQRGDEELIAGHHGRAVACHAAALGERAEGEGPLRGDLQDGRRGLAGVDVVVALVREEQDVVVAAELDQAFQVLVSRCCACGVVGVVDPEYPRAFGIYCLGLQQETIIPFQLHRQGLAAGEQRAPFVDGVAGRAEGDAAPLVRVVQEGQRSVEDCLLGACGWQDPALGIERDPMAAFHPAAEGLAETLLACRARVSADLGDAFYQGVADLPVRRLAWVAGAEVEEIHPLLLQLPAAFVEAQKRVGALPREYGVEE